MPSKVMCQGHEVGAAEACEAGVDGCCMSSCDIFWRLPSTCRYWFSAWWKGDTPEGVASFQSSPGG